MSKQPVRASVRSVNSPEAVLRAALTALSCCREEQVSLDEYLDSHLHDPQLRRRLSNLLFNCCRHRRQVQKAIDACCRKKPEKRLYDLLTAALTMAAFQNSLVPESVVNIAVTLAKKEFSASAGRFVNAVLRKALTLIELNSAELLPPMIEKRWKERFEPEVFKFLTDLFITPAPGTVRLRNDFEVTGELADELVPLELETPWRFFQCNDLGNLL